MLGGNSPFTALACPSDEQETDALTRVHFGNLEQREAARLSNPNGSVHFRLARREDLARIVELLADDPLGAIREYVSDPVSDEYIVAFEQLIAQPGNCVIVAELDDAVVGCLQLMIVPGLSRRGAKRAFIEGVRVSSVHRRRGIGELLVLEAIERARAASCALVQLTTDATRKDAHRFYERLGFVATHIGYKLDIA